MGGLEEVRNQYFPYGGPPIPQMRKAMMGTDDKGLLF